MAVICAFKSRQSCPALCNPMGCNLPGSPVHGILQAKILEWLSCPPPGDLPDLGLSLVSLVPPILAGRFFITRATIVMPILLSFLIILNRITPKNQKSKRNIHPKLQWGTGTIAKIWKQSVHQGERNKEELLHVHHRTCIRMKQHQRQQPPWTYGYF